MSWRSRLEEVRSAPRPHHVAVVMDGNGRWAAARALPRAEGHRKGGEAAENLIRLAAEEELCRHLTLFAFSTENWERPSDEVLFLMDLLGEFLVQKLGELADAGVRMEVIGQRDRLPPALASEVRRAEERTRTNQRLLLHVALSFGGRWSVVEGMRKAVEEACRGDLRPEDVDAACVHRLMPTAGLPDVDLVIRTGGEQRLSNFLLWEAAYAELFFTPVLFPDFDGATFVEAVHAYQGRQRNFGKVLP